MSDEVLVKAEGVSKKFCRSLKRSLWYGVQDVTSEMFGRKGHHDDLRTNEFWAVKDISFELKRGECLGLIGPNGAGKSTLLKMLNGLVKPDEGRITMRGRVGALIELGAGFNPILTARENIYINGSVLGFSKTEVDSNFDAIIDFAEIDEFVDTPVQNFSSGMKVRLGFAIAAQLNPDVLLIDEVLAVGDASFRAKCMAKMYEQLNRSCVIFVSHSMAQINRICNLGLYINHGKTTGISNHVASAIENYLEDCQSLKTTLVGEKIVDLDDLRLSSGQNISKDSAIRMLFGSNLQLAVTVTLRSAVKRGAFMLAFFDQELRNVAECFSGSQPFEEIRPHNSYRISVNMPVVNLGPGKYSIQFSCVSLDNEGRREKIHFVFRDLAKLVVTGADYSYASSQFQGDWSLIATTEENASAVSE